MQALFLVGEQRSGSNLLRLMISNSHEIGAPHPPHILQRIHPLVPVYQVLSDSQFEQMVDVVCNLVEVEDQAAPLQAILAPVDADPGQPGLERGALAELAEVLPRPEKALLRGAVGLAHVPEEAVGDARDLALVLPDEVLEPFRISGADLLDQARFVDAGVRLAGDHGQNRHNR